jgi:DNA modification methylase
MPLTDREKEQLKTMIDAGEPLPPKYRSSLFAEPHEAELIWPGKTSEVTSVVLPFQSIEQIDEPRTEMNAQVGGLFDYDAQTGRQAGGWSNKLIWGDNKLVLASLKNGPLRQEIEKAGGLKLVYIDPPFDVGADFSIDLEVGDGDTLTKQPSVIEDIAYRDTWGRGTDSFLSMLYERLQLIHSLMASDGSLYVHCDYRVSHLIHCALNEIFGSANFQNDVVWCYNVGGKGSQRWARKHDIIFFVTKSSVWFFDGKAAGIMRDTGTKSFGGIIGKDADGRPYQDKLVKATGKYYRYYLDEPKIPEDWWTDINSIQSGSEERIEYPTQKPEALMQRIISASSRSGDLIADFFCGSGTTLAVAEKLGRKWIGCDLGRFGVHTTRKRLIGVQRELKAANKPYRSFEILNLGKYERQYFVGIDPMLPEKERRALSLQKEEHYLTLILNAYKAERAFQSPPFHGRKAGSLVLVGPIDAPVTQSQVHEAVAAARKLKVSRVDVLGFEFEMGLVPHAQDEARAKGVSLALRYIPKDVFDRRAVDKGQVVFYDVAFVEVHPAVKGQSVTVTLKDFGVYYRQDDVEALVSELKNGGSKVTVDKGQVVKVTKDKSGVAKREVLTKSWQDWIDYWAVDFHFTSRAETIRVMEADTKGELHERSVRTGNFIFENEWQAFRTRQDRTLEMKTAPHDYPKKGKYKIAVKVIDIFGNDTTKVVEVTI